MAGSENLVILSGNLGSDPDIRGGHTGGGQIANLRLATTDSWNDKDSGERREKTEWHTVVLFGALARTAQQYLKKGSRVYIRGSLRYNEWEDKQTGVKRRNAEIVAQHMIMLDGRPSLESQPSPSATPRSAPQRGYTPPQSGRNSMQNRNSIQTRQLQAAKWDEDLDDSIPFE